MDCKHETLRYTIRTNSLRIAGGEIRNYRNVDETEMSMDPRPATMSVKVKCYDCHYSYERPISVLMSFDNEVRLAAVTMGIMTRNIEVSQ